MGMGTVCVHLDGCHSRHNHEFPAAERPQPRGDNMLRGNGSERARSVQTAYRQRERRVHGVAHSRRRELHHRCRVLQSEQTQVHAHGVPLLRAARFGVPYIRRVAHTIDLSINKIIMTAYLFTTYNVIKTLKQSSQT